MKLKVLKEVIIPILVINGLLSTLESALGIETGYKPFALIVSLFLSARAIYYKTPIIQIQTLVGLAFLGNELFFLVLPLIFLPKLVTNLLTRRNGLIVKKLQSKIILFLVYSILLISLTYAFDFSFFNIFFWFLAFGSLLLLFVYYLEFSYEVESVVEFFEFFKKLILVQVVIIALQSVIHQDFNPGDSWTGSSGNSVVMGFYILLGLTFYFARYFFRTSQPKSFFSIFTVKNLFILSVGGLILYLNDSKMVILCFIVALLFYSLFHAAVKFLSTLRKPFLYYLVGIFALILIGLFTVYWSANFYVKSKYTDKENVGSLLSDYTNPELEKGGGNGKLVLYKRIFVDLLTENPFAWSFGIGPGKFGSKAANIMAYDILYKLENQNKLPTFIKPYSAKLTKKYMGDLWTKDIVEINKYRSATLAMPFAGLITLKGEYGFVGLVFFVLLIYSISYYLLRKAYAVCQMKLEGWAFALSIFWFSLPFQMIFDNFQEKSDIILPMILLTAMMLSMTNGRAATSDQS